MLKKMLMKIFNMVERILYKLISPKLREKIKSYLSDSQKQAIKKLFFAGRWQRSVINETKHRLYNMGFEEKGLAELEDYANTSSDPYLSRLAIWEIALWHANQYTKENARVCLEYLAKFLKKERDPIKIREAAVMEAECYDMIGERQKAKDILNHALKKEAHLDLYLAAANLETSSPKRLDWINKAFSLFQLSNIQLEEDVDGEKTVYDRLIPEALLPQKTNKEKITVIMPVYNAEDVIITSLKSVLSQTWENLEVLVVNDCSTDNTVELVKDIATHDDRVKLIQLEKNGGAYVARNHALRLAVGDFITIHDADDWSHPQKMEIQVKHLLANEKQIGNTSEQARTTNDLKFYRRGKPGKYIFSNMSSFMFRRKKVFEALGFWDSVRFAADSEFIRRIKKKFGEKSVVEVRTGPLSFQRQTATSLTGNSAFGYHGFKMGARREYEESHDYYHETSDNLYYDFPQVKRPYAVPEPMWPQKEDKIEGRRQFDYVIFSDFRTDNVKELDLIKKIRQFKGDKARIGLTQIYKRKLDPGLKIQSDIRELLNNNSIYMLVYGEKVKTNHAIVLDVASFNDPQKYIPQIEADELVILADEESINKETSIYLKEVFLNMSHNTYLVNTDLLLEELIGEKR